MLFFSARPFKADVHATERNEACSAIKHLPIISSGSKGSNGCWCRNKATVSSLRCINAAEILVSSQEGLAVTSFEVVDVSVIIWTRVSGRLCGLVCTTNEKCRSRNRQLLTMWCVKACSVSTWLTVGFYLCPSRANGWR